MSKQKTILELAQGLDFKQEFEYTQYIIESLINGQKQQVKDLFKDISPDEIDTFQRDLLTLGSEKYTIEVLKVCGYSKTAIENVFFDGWENVPHFEM